MTDYPGGTRARRIYSFFFFQDDEKLKTNRKGWLYVETTRDVKEIKLNYNLISFQLYSLNCVISYNSTQL